VSAALSPADRLDKYIAEDRLIRGQWDDGKNRASLLAALAPTCGSAESAAVCPAEIMPAWLAHLTPWLGDNGSISTWPAMVRRYAAVAHRWHVLTPETWRRLDYAARAICVREALRHTTNAGAIEACETVIALCDRAASGDQPAAEAWSKAAGAAWAEAWAAGAAWAEAWAAGAAWAAWAAAAEATAREAEAAAWAGAAARAAARAAAAADRITAAILSAIEAACTEAEVQS
jgi:hypothetical protein